MDASEFREKIDKTSTMIVAAIPKADNPADALMAELLALGIELVGEFLIDVKRLADAAELANRIQAQRFDFKDVESKSPTP